LDADVTNIDDAKLSERVDSQCQVRSVATLWDVVGGSDGLWSEAGAWSIAGSGIERGSDDHRLGAGQRLWLTQTRSRHAEKGGVRAILMGRARPEMRLLIRAWWIESLGHISSLARVSETKGI
jgi:hypothetical protein